MNISIAELERKSQSRIPAVFIPKCRFRNRSSFGTDYSFGSQMWNKFNQSIGVTLSIPIFPTMKINRQSKRPQLVYESSQLDFLNAEKELLKTVEESTWMQFLLKISILRRLNDLNLLKKVINSQRSSFIWEWKIHWSCLRKRPIYFTAQQEVLQSKYMSILSIQLLNFYQKKPIDINY